MIEHDVVCGITGVNRSEIRGFWDIGGMSGYAECRVTLR